VVWDSRPVRITADEALEQEAENRKGGSMAEAKEFLRDKLDGGASISAKDLEDEAESIGISKRTLKRARKNLKVKSIKDGYQGKWNWRFDKD
jgi:hypothetical protein